ncbi:hypothetical protein MGG_18026 [Pyricularia oryzae 70-15]|uniref:Uncharacterized protein n=3 Tax=Pyricularia oryzae TaxID=318829 RepID=G5EH60_PYRO7|nr:uncharacterized protein MGG_18026 [Pyricularia oryzae 70-15]EAQ70880.1 hypothetical protein MGCH7_ch7g287 [Pyricularia oryzae 70-15]EHA46484.1 hypothetical protein MGG_18026 [Pyricularia oryzae 70-15]ELQ35037.1 hypothetical protein OOU_Y34scaffold00728g1 [Pyricularia oryzae Y34]
MDGNILTCWLGVGGGVRLYDDVRLELESGPIGDRPSNSLLWFLHHLVLVINLQAFLCGFSGAGR